MPSKPSTVNRDLRTLRAALKKAPPEYRFPAGAFFREDETRVPRAPAQESWSFSRRSLPRSEESPSWSRSP
jgi:hypothetical protein